MCCWFFDSAQPTIYEPRDALVSIVNDDVYMEKDKPVKVRECHVKCAELAELNNRIERELKELKLKVSSVEEKIDSITNDLISERTEAVMLQR